MMRESLTVDGLDVQTTRLPRPDGAFGAHDVGSELLERYGYRTSEVLLRGRALGEPFTTRVLLRRPASGDSASGTVILEPMHFAGGRPVWNAAHEYILRSGHAWAEVACQTTPALKYLKAFDPGRYAAVQLSGRTATALPTDGEGSPRERSDAFARTWWETSPQTTAILQITVAALRSGAVDAGPVRTVVVAGSSQTGGVVRRLGQRLSEGSAGPDEGVPDGLLPMHSGGAALRGVPVPAIELIAEADLESVRRPKGLPGQGRGLEHRKSLGDTYQIYEVAGMSHVDSRYRQPGGTAPLGTRWSTFPHTHVTHAVVDALIAWVRDGVRPPSATMLATEPGTDAVRRDGDGHALGGLQLPATLMPTAHVDVLSPGPLWIFGIEAPLSGAELIRRYGSTDSYLGRAREILDALVAERRYLRADADRWLRETDRALREHLS
ncbi:alpha/beta hydrolase domain-containing protein [Sinomonas susongensis]|uniref:alpha/beta hydrolase domain-containing protein n=1 Tax=Sinomonas susongensis TaxID=1324851 RepID=UPI0011082AEE|nr:alpha/beta hydrolase domain-containing protein [Sinomonas susongensis]